MALRSFDCWLQSLSYLLIHIYQIRNDLTCSGGYLTPLTPPQQTTFIFLLNPFHRERSFREATKKNVVVFVIFQIMIKILFYYS